MPSPFPGMDPYLEGYLWPDVHNALAYKLRQLLVPQIRPRYTARLEITVYVDSAPENEVGIMYPDVDVLLNQPRGNYPLPETGEFFPTATAPTPATLTIPLFPAVEVRVPSIEIRDTASHLLVTSIEILSPVNKREPHLTAYRQKRQRLHHGGVHILELDLLRRGTRPLVHPRIPPVEYLISLTRAETRFIDLWPLTVKDRLPTVPVPLRQPDPDVTLDLQAVLNACYDEAAYELSIDYSQPPPPPLMDTDQALSQD